MKERCGLKRQDSHMIGITSRMTSPMKLRCQHPGRVWLRFGQDGGGKARLTLVPPDGLEPPTLKLDHPPRASCRAATQSPFIEYGRYACSARRGTRTPGQRLRRSLLYPLSYAGVPSATLPIIEACSLPRATGPNIRHGSRYCEASRVRLSWPFFAFDKRRLT